MVVGLLDKQCGTGEASAKSMATKSASRLSTSAWKSGVSAASRDYVICSSCFLAADSLSSWLLASNSYHTVDGNATLPCGVSINTAAANAKASGGGPELGSRALPLPTDDELIKFAKATLRMDG